MIKVALTLTIGMLVASSAGIVTSAQAQAPEVRISGSSGAIRTVLIPKSREIEQSAGVTLRLNATGSGRGMRDLAQGQIELAIISAPLEDTVEDINKRAPGSLTLADFNGTKIQEVPLGFIVHPSNPLPRISLENLAKLLKGEASNWSEVGGPNVPVLVVAEGGASGVKSVVENVVLNDQPFTDKIREVANSAQAVAVVSQVPGAISMAAKVNISGAVRIIDTDRPVNQQYYLVTKGPPNAVAQRVIAEVQRLINQ
jgi:phosphate transport system substrate-binding protein